MRGAWVRWFCVALCLAASPAPALQLDLPLNASLTASRDSAQDQIGIPVGPFTAGAVQTRTFEGEVTRRAYRVNAPGLTPLQILAPLREQIKNAGFDLVLECNQISCGGYDFRFAIEVLPAPNMYVNIRAFHFVTAINPQADEAITLLASAAGGAGYLQIMRVGAIDAAPVLPEAPVQPATQAPAQEFAAQLLANGHVVLHGLDFASGTTSLGDQSSPALEALALLMTARPALQIAVVGHTDTVGGLAANIAVSRARAQAVRTALIDIYSADGARIEAEGMGYLAPFASNLTAEGREANRRVEVIVVGEDG